jgi:hypothetical protein
VSGVTPGQFLQFAAAVAVLVLLGFLFIRLVCGRAMTPLLSWTFAPAVGAGLCSLIEFVFRRPMFTVEFFLLLVLSIRACRKAGAPISEWVWRPAVPAVVLLFAVAVGWVLAQLITMVTRLPHGGTDGWAIWNSHARFIFRDGPRWAADIENSFHADYPLLVPLMSARIWRYAGDSTDLSGLWAVLFALAGTVMLVATISQVRAVSTGVVMGFVLLGTPIYLQSAGGQEADVPIAVFYLATVSLLILASLHDPDRGRITALAGFTAGCAAWTKNEGILFLVATSFIVLAPIVRQRSETIRRLAWFSSGLIVPLSILVFFKVTNVAPSDFFDNRHSDELMAKIWSPERYWIILASAGQTIKTFGHWATSPFIPLLAFLILKGVDRQMLRTGGWISSVAILVIVSCGYFAVYVITPMDLQWHVGSSLERLMLQLWPSVLLLAALATKGVRQE